jgi:hypothetical protein
MGSDVDRTAELVPSWLGSVLVRWEPDGEASVLAGPSADALPAPGPLHVLTSQDPGGVEQQPERNQELLADLLRWAAAALGGVPWWLATGCDPTAGHAEQGIVVAGLPRSAAVAHGARWGQLAIYEVTDADLIVVPCGAAPVAEADLARTARRWPEDGPDVQLEDLPLDRWWRAYGAALARAGVDYAGGGTLAT